MAVRFDKSLLFGSQEMLVSEFEKLSSKKGKKRLF